MAAERRIVRVSSSFFDQLDEQLRAERGDDGEPSAADFVVIELPAVIERFATSFEGLPEMIDGASGAHADSAGSTPMPGKRNGLSGVEGCGGGGD